MPDLNKLRFSIKDVALLLVLILAPIFYLAGSITDGDEIKKVVTGLIEGGVVMALLKAWTAHNKTKSDS